MSVLKEFEYKGRVEESTNAASLRSLRLGVFA
jgi:hypothetical protein